MSSAYQRRQSGINVLNGYSERDWLDKRKATEEYARVLRQQIDERQRERQRQLDIDNARQRPSPPPIQPRPLTPQQVSTSTVTPLVSPPQSQTHEPQSPSPIPPPATTAPAPQPQPPLPLPLPPLPVQSEQTSAPFTPPLSDARDSEFVTILRDSFGLHSQLDDARARQRQRELDSAALTMERERARTRVYETENERNRRRRLAEEVDEYEEAHEERLYQPAVPALTLTQQPQPSMSYQQQYYTQQRADRHIEPSRRGALEFAGPTTSYNAVSAASVSSTDSVRREEYRRALLAQIAEREAAKLLATRLENEREAKEAEAFAIGAGRRRGGGGGDPHRNADGDIVANFKNATAISASTAQPIMTTKTLTAPSHVLSSTTPRDVVEAAPVAHRIPFTSQRSWNPEQTLANKVRAIAYGDMLAAQAEEKRSRETQARAAEAAADYAEEQRIRAEIDQANNKMTNKAARSQQSQPQAQLQAQAPSAQSPSSKPSQLVPARKSHYSSPSKYRRRPLTFSDEYADMIAHEDSEDRDDEVDGIEDDMTAMMIQDIKKQFSQRSNNNLSSDWPTAHIQPPSFHHRQAKDGRRDLTIDGDGGLLRSQSVFISADESLSHG